MCELAELDWSSTRASFRWWINFYHLIYFGEQYWADIRNLADRVKHIPFWLSSKMTSRFVEPPTKTLTLMLPNSHAMHEMAIQPGLQPYTTYVARNFTCLHGEDQQIG